VLSADRVLQIIAAAEKAKRYNSRNDIALLLARYEKENDCKTFIEDVEVNVVQHGDSPLHLHHHGTATSGIYHLGILVEGLYYPDAETVTEAPHHGHAAEHAETTVSGSFERFTRLLNISVAVE
jgi:hypothetical protein